MSYENLLINTCTIQSYTSVSDAYGQPIKTWDTKVVDGVAYEDIRCRHVSGKGREVKVGQETHIIYDQLFIEDLTVTVWDRVEIYNLDGTVRGTYNIVDVLFRQDSVDGHHKQLYLERVE